MKGKIISDCFPMCGVCGNDATYLSERTPAKALKQAKEVGWRMTRKHGLVCPSCSKDL